MTDREPEGGQQGIISLLRSLPRPSTVAPPCRPYPVAPLQVHPLECLFAYPQGRYLSSRCPIRGLVERATFPSGAVVNGRRWRISHTTVSYCWAGHCSLTPPLPLLPALLVCSLFSYFPLFLPSILLFGLSPSTTCTYLSYASFRHSSAPSWLFDEFCTRFALRRFPSRLIISIPAYLSSLLHLLPVLTPSRIPYPAPSAIIELSRSHLSSST